MPELPEVQTIVSDLQNITNDIFTGFWSDWEKVIRDENKKNITLKKFVKKLVGKKIVSVRRLGKNIALDLNNKTSLLIHLRMTGRLLVSDQSSITKNQKKYGKHVHHIFFLKKNHALVFHDVRKFATIDFIPTNNLLEKLQTGTDPFSKNFSLIEFKKIINSKQNKTIKEVLMDSGLILGIGNIYASEILFAARVLPERIIKSLTNLEQGLIFKSIKKILTKAIRLRGTSISDYRDSAGKKGSFQNELMVYKRNKQKCKKCDTIIQRSVIAQRSSFFCINCQK